jgi:glutamine amidotransferase
MKVVIIKYNAGNIHSVRLALQRLGIEPEVTADADKIKSADKVIFPGVGEASTAMSFITNNGIADTIQQLQQPVLGICLGLQLMGTYSEENNTKCMGIFDLNIKKFPIPDRMYLSLQASASAVRGNLLNNIGIASSDENRNRNDKQFSGTKALSRYKVPHMGWNLIENLSNPLFEKLPENPYVYFVHSYYAEICDQTIATTDYILPFSSAIQKDNFFAVQFHPEKSGKVGEQILRNFLEL